VSDDALIGARRPGAERRGGGKGEMGRGGRGGFERETQAQNARKAPSFLLSS